MKNNISFSQINELLGKLKEINDRYQTEVDPIMAELSELKSKCWHLNKKDTNTGGWNRAFTCPDCDSYLVVEDRG